MTDLSYNIAELSAIEQAYLLAGGVSIFHFSANSQKGPRVWYVLALHLLKENDFKRDLQQDGIDLNLRDYGIILASGMGDGAPEEALLELESRYSIPFTAKN